MLSKEDILNELGKNIMIYPLDNPSATIQGSSVDLTISKYAWSLTKETGVYDSSAGTIHIAPHDTVCAYTKEVLYVSNKISGVYSSTVSNCFKGINPISTNLDPNYIGRSLLILHNITDNEIVLHVGSPIVSVQFFYVKTPVYVRECNIQHDSLVSSLIGSNDPLYNEYYESYLHENWAKNRREMIMKYREKEFATKLKQYIKTQKQNFSFGYKFINSRIFRYFASILIAVALYFLMDWLSKNAKVSVSDVSKAFLSFVFSIVSNDLIKEKQ